MRIRTSTSIATSRVATSRVATAGPFSRTLGEDDAGLDADTRLDAGAAHDADTPVR